MTAEEPSLTFTQVAEVLEDAAERLEQCPWGQGEKRRLESRICAEDAIFLTLSGVKDIKNIADAKYGSVELYVWLKFDQVHEVLQTYLPPRQASYEDATGPTPVTRTFEIQDSLYVWNDEPGRTKDEVVELFKNVAKDLRDKAQPE